MWETRYIEPLYFFVAFAIGMLYVYISTPDPEIIIKYPVPGEDIVYKDYADMCYRYKSEEVKCSVGGKNIKDIKVQYGKVEEPSIFSKLF